MVDLDWKSKMVSSTISPNSPKLSLPDKTIPTFKLPLRINDISSASSQVCSAYENYLRLPHLRNLWASNDFPNWTNEPILKPALQALEITFRLLATVSSDPRPYANRREWTRRVESLAAAQVHIIAMLCEDEEQNPETRGKAPVSDLNSINHSQSRSYSETSLLPRLATWQKSKDVAQRILCSVECEMMRCPYTLGLGEANLAGKPVLMYDAVCRPNEIHSLQTTPYDHVGNYENRTLHATHQIVESWARASRRLLERVTEAMESRSFEKAASDCYAVERIWKFLADVEDMHLMMDPEDLLRLKKQLGIRSWAETVPFCFRSKELVEITRVCRDLKHKVPEILEVEVDPKGGPRIMEAAMKVYADKRSGFERVHVLQAMQAIESAMKRFFYAYKQVVTVAMGSSEANGNHSDSGDSLSHIFLEPTYFPSLDAAKTFLGYYWENNENAIPS
ncbi:nematode resistance protein-like HSPRO2 [Gastrolobium bilobum]|uniref:nematode resistance protein-like HSPRO2 n=1 Tax=Gastrolobium bilobum TaxID=150636 RepID=UPI002AB17345|nr:nematode resistance protein-like HSPRO2 [Gastrolobium bilobum]